MVSRRYRQRSLAEMWFRESADDCWEAWMRQADTLLDDPELVEKVYDALARRWPRSLERGRSGTPADVVLRLLLLKHVRNWSYRILEREVRANLVYHLFTRIGAEKVPDAHTAARGRRQLLDQNVVTGRTRRAGGGRPSTEKKRPT